LQKVLVLGAAGMLGHAMMRYLATVPDVAVAGTVRAPRLPPAFPPALADRVETGIEASDDAALRRIIAAFRPDAIINCIGLIKQRPGGQDPEQTILVNALLPHRLARLASEGAARLVHLSTDCVFSGVTGGYTEDDVPDARDFYGRSKLLGEVTEGDAITLRTSIIGPELGPALGLVGWFLNQAGSAPGYRQAIFSGLPTVELARVIHSHVLPARDLRGLFHVSAAPISKFDLLSLVAEAYGSPAELVPDDAFRIDRSLDSTRFRAITGYVPPDWPTLVAEMKAFG
jgi:dTDP-4-dehydrorhamnose reductase